MQLKIRFLLVLLGFSFMSFSQEVTLSPKAQISIITCGPGQELYSTFGHSAFRLQDPVLGIDVVYNYGTFNFNTPNFYMKFVQGKLLYSLSRQKFEDFLWTYEMENRWVQEQLLNLDPKETKNLFEFLENNFKPENRDYQYDFFFDNCSSKIRDVLNTVFGDRISYHEDHLIQRYTFRQLIHQSLVTNSWSAFGIDLALGSVIDKQATPNEHMFLPIYVMGQMANTDLDQEPIVKRERSIMEFESQDPYTYFLLTPLFWVLALMVFVLVITLIDFKNNSRSRWLDFFLSFSTGITGLLIIFLWFFTDHTATSGNLNILWAFPLNIVSCFYLAKTKPLPNWMQKYFIVLTVLLFVTPMVWLTGMQIFSPLIAPLLVLLAARYFFLLHWFKRNIKK
ncbi:DUF4105 domain-containing protein [Flavobacteriaceae bacterium KMM 6898]|nr:DUF4105 domain-containing protein [Flavobacteriaceae bacterium KMM 6898]